MALRSVMSVLQYKNASQSNSIDGICIITESNTKTLGVKRKEEVEEELTCVQIRQDEAILLIDVVVAVINLKDASLGKQQLILQAHICLPVHPPF